MPSQEEIDVIERQELRDKAWIVGQWLAVLLAIFIAGVLVGLIKPTVIAPIFRPLGIQGPAGQLQEKVEQLEERKQGLVKERDTLRSKVTLMDRDKKEMDRQLQEAQAKAAACAGSAP